MEKKKFKEKVRDYWNDKGEMQALAVGTIAGLIAGIGFLCYRLGQNDPNTMIFKLHVDD